MGLEERDPGEISVCLGAATEAVQRVLQAAVEFGTAEQGAEFHLRGDGRDSLASKGRANGCGEAGSG